MLSKLSFFIAVVLLLIGCYLVAEVLIYSTPLSATLARLITTLPTVVVFAVAWLRATKNKDAPFQSAYGQGYAQIQAFKFAGLTLVATLFVSIVLAISL